jgi:hypothetical protein
MNNLSTSRPKTKDEDCWYFVPYINIKEDEETYAFNKILVQHGAKLKWKTKRMGWCWFPSLNVYGMTLVFFLLVLNHFSVEWKLFSKVCDPLMYSAHTCPWFYEFTATNNPTCSWIRFFFALFQLSIENDIWNIHVDNSGKQRSCNSIIYNVTCKQATEGKVYKPMSTTFPLPPSTKWTHHHQLF